MKSSERRTVRKVVRRRSSQCIAILCAFAAFSSTADAATVRDNFSSQSWSQNNGTDNWSGDWIEVDDDEIGPSDGNVWIETGELRLEDQPDTGGQPSAAREADLSGAIAATLSFDWRTTSGVDPSDSIILEVSANGGGSWTILENFTGYDGTNSGSRTYNIAPYAAVDTQVRFRVNNLYGGGNESFRLDFIEIDYQVALTGTNLSISQSDTPDPVDVASSMSYTLSVANTGPDDATGVTVTDTLPAGVTFESASATQGSCSHVAGIVTCLLGDMVAGANATINIALTAPVVTGIITNSATVSGNETDPLLANNTSDEDTVVQNLNVNQLCYLVADAGGGNGGNDLFTRIDTADFDPVTNETDIGTGTGTDRIEAIAFNSASGIVYAADEDRLGTLSTVSGVFTPLSQDFGSGDGAFGNEDFDDVDGLAYDAMTGTLYGVQARGGTDLLIQINMTTGAHVPNAFGAGTDYVPLPQIGGNSITDDIAIDPTTGIMYAAVNGGGVTDRLITIDKATGATTDVALITVPDIEGLGTDPTGQLWGTSGTQDIIYEIDKVTGVGSNGRSIDNGGDYESVDCFAFSPSATADLGVAKIVDDATPREGDTVTYTVTVTNSGPGPATVVQLMDLLPSGLTLVSATTGQGTYDAITGDWFVGTLPVGSNTTLTLQATVDAGSGGTTITNTAAVEFLSQIDSNPANDTASVDINPLGLPDLTVVKDVTTVEDPINGTTNPYAIPGATMSYTILTTNTGTGPADTDTLVVTDPIPANTGLRVIDFDGATSGPVQFTNGTPSSGLTYSFVALDDPDDDVSFSDNNGTDFDYEPSADANGVDLAVTDIKVELKGSFAAGAGDPSMQVAFKVIVQ